MPTVPLRPSSLRILVVDDHGDSARVLARLLRRAGHIVASAVSVSDGLAVAAGFAEIDLLVSDLELPDGDGIGLLKTLRARFEGAPLLAMMLSSHDEPHWVDAAAGAGYACFLSKPLVLEDLLAAIDRHCAAVAEDRSVVPSR